MTKQLDERLSRLLDAAKEVLPGLPGFRSASLFGSLAEGRADGYSDIDVTITTDDLPAARERFVSTIEQIGRVEFGWLMAVRPTEWVFTTALRDESYYHRLDVDLVDSSAEDRTLSIAKTVLLVEGQGTPMHPAGKSDAYVPDHGSIGHYLLAQYLGCLRYLKARKRGQVLTCYRFAIAMFDVQLALLYGRLTGDPTRRSKLSTEEYKHLDSLLPADDRNRLLSTVDFSTMPAMDNSVRVSMDEMFQAAHHLASISGEPLRTDVFERIKAFAKEELST